MSSTALVPHGIGNHPYEARFNKSASFGWLGIPVGLGDRVKRRFQRRSAPSGFSARPKMRWNVGWRNRRNFYAVVETCRDLFIFIFSVPRFCSLVSFSLL